MNRRLLSLVLFAVALVTGACVSGDDGRIAGPSRAEIVVQFSRDPLAVTRNTGADAGSHPLMVSFEVIVTEKSGVSANMINQTLVGSPDLGPLKVQASAPSATIPAAGSLTIPMTLLFAQFPPGGTTMALTVNALDVAGNIVTGIGVVRINP